jgi:hypothetical protein
VKLGGILALSWRIGFPLPLVVSKLILMLRCGIFSVWPRLSLITIPVTFWLLVPKHCHLWKLYLGSPSNYICWPLDHLAMHSTHAASPLLGNSLLTVLAINKGYLFKDWSCNPIIFDIHLQLNSFFLKIDCFQDFKIYVAIFYRVP